MSVNKVILIGHLGKDPDVRYLDSGVAVAQFSLATTEKGYTAKNGQQIPDRTEWHNLVLWRGWAETAEKYLHKGDKIYVEGKLRSRSYDDQQGVKRTIVEVYVDYMEMLSQKSAGKPLPGEIPPPASASSAQPVQQPSVQQTPFGPVQQGQLDLEPTPKDDLPF